MTNQPILAIQEERTTLSRTVSQPATPTQLQLTGEPILLKTELRSAGAWLRKVESFLSLIPLVMIIFHGVADSPSRGSRSHASVADRDIVLSRKSRIHTSHMRISR